MPFAVKVRSFLRNLFSSRHVATDLDAEVRAHLDLLTEENLRAGRVAHANGGVWFSKLNLRVPHPLRFAAKSGRVAHPQRQRQSQRQKTDTSTAVVVSSRFAMRQAGSTEGCSHLARRSSWVPLRLVGQYSSEP